MLCPILYNIRWCVWKEFRSLTNQIAAMKTNYYLNRFNLFFLRLKTYCNFRSLLTILMVAFFSLSGFAQKGNGNGNGNKPKDLVIRSCTTYIGNGLYSASFSYENPTNQEIIVAEDDSFVKYNNGNNKTKSLNKFKKGNVNKAFTKEFSSGGSVEWTVIQSNGKSHTVVANANSSHCTDEEEGFIFPVYKQGTGKSEDIIGQELTALADTIAGDIPDPLVYQINNNKVLIEIVPIDGRITNVITLLQSDFGLSFDPNPDFPDFIIDELTLPTLEVIDVYFPIDSLLSLNAYTNDINFARVLYPPIKNTAGDGFTGNAVSQGDATQKSDIVRESFRLIKNIDSVTTTVLPVDGTGITIGVMSNSYDTQSFTDSTKATVDVLNGDLPGADNTHGYTSDVVVLKEYPYGIASDEGRAMMHIIHDVAPGAKLAFHTGSLSPRNFEVGFKALAGFNELNQLNDLISDIIVDDITFITEPFFGEGRISETIKTFSAAGGIHFTSAGNFANNGYQGVFNATTTLPMNNNFLEATARAHIFDGTTGDYLQEIAVKAGETYMIVLQWDEASASQDNSNGADVDLDFYIVDNSGRLLVGNNRSNENGDAAEIMVFTATADGTANIMITSANGATTVPFRYIAFQSSGLTLNQFNDGSPTISGHAMTPESVTVGAIRFNRDDPEAFSSFGGTLLDSIGTMIGVDFAAPDGVNTNVGSIGTDTYADGTEVDGDIFKNFFGTSAAAPSAAAAVALLESALPTWYPAGYNGDIIQLFKDNAKGSANPLQAGAGMIDVNKVFNSLASQTARITSFTILDNDDGTTPIASIDTLKINVIGDFFPPPPSEGEPSAVKFYMDGVELTGTVLTNGSIEAIIPPFSGNPELQVYTEPKVGSEGNGGFSEPYDFFQDGKIALTVKANPADTVNDDGSITQNPVTIKFGEDYKSKLTYTVEGVPEAGFLDENGDPATFEDIFPTVVFETPVDNLAYPDVNNYPVTPSFNDEPYDTDKYIVNFKNGDLVIEKNYLTIKPKDSTFNYGDIIRNTLIYQVTDADGNVISETDEGDYAEIGDDGTVLKSISDFYSAIQNAHQEDFYYDTFNEGNTEPVMLLINDFNENSDRYSDITALLENGGWISSENSILNGLIRQQAVINEFRQRAIINELRQSAVINDFRVSAIMNTLRIDKSYFTNYIDWSLTNTRQLAIMNDEWVTDTEDILNELRQGAVINDYRISAIMNEMRVGAIMNTLDVMDLNVDVKVNDSISRQLGIENELRQLGVINELRVSAVINELRQSAIINETNPGGIIKDKVFSLIDYTDAPTDVPNEIQKFYSLNLITGVEVTNGQPHLIFPGAFLNSMAANFYIRYEKGNLTIEPGTLSVETEDFSSEYDTIITDEALPTTFTTVDTNFELIEAIFPDGIPYYFMKEGKSRDNCVDDDCTEYTMGGPIKMDVGIYEIYIDDVANNYDLVYGDNHGKLIITEAKLTVNNTTAANIEYGGTPVITTNITRNNDPDVDVSTAVFPDPDQIPYFFMKQGETPDCETCIKYHLPYVIGTDKMDVGEYDIFITDDPNDNYAIVEYAENRGTLTVTEATLTVNTTTAVNINYGGSPVIITDISGFGNGEDASVLSGTNGIPYFFMKAGETRDDCVDCSEYTIDGDIKMDVGVYDIFIDDLSDNYTIDHASGRGTLTIEKANLSVTITPTESIINQGDTPGLTASFGPFAYADENEFNVFQPEGITYYFVDEDGYEGSITDAGVLTVKIEDPTNYEIVYNNEAKLFINPDDVSKIRTYADCVAYDPVATDGL